MIEKERIEHIKSTIDMVALAQAKGITMKKNGKSYLGLCPFHNDTNPSLSITPLKNEWHCFGCGKGGDVIRFIELFDQVDFREAVKRLSGNHETEHTEPPVCKNIPSPANQQYLERVVAIYAKNFIQKDQGKDYLNDRGITDAGLFVKYNVGFCDGTLNDILPGNGGVRQELKQLGILLEDGSERFLNCVVFPVYDMDGHIITLYGRCIASNQSHLFLPGRPTGLWNGSIIKTCSELILTESVLDALSIQMAGYPNAISIQGTNGLADQEIMELKNYNVQKLILVLDGDSPGVKASGQLKEKLKDFALDIRLLPENHDPNSYLQNYGAKKLAQFLQSEQISVSLPEGFVIACGMRQYQIMGIDKGPRRLKVTLRLEHAGKLHVDTIDLYIARARKNLASDLCRVFEEPVETIESDITRIIRECEQDKEEPVLDAAVVLTEKEKTRAELFGRSKDLIKNILADFETCGLIDEDANKLLGYIAMTSRKRNKPLSIQILSSSGSGKTALQDAVVNFCPPEDLIKLTSLSGKALFYKDRLSLKHKVLALEEGAGAEDASYAIRSLISSGVLINETTIKDLSTGRLTTMENRVEGPTAVFYTTTNPDVDPETKSRFFVTGIDESREQTRKILAFQRENHSRDDMTESVKTKEIVKKHINFQRLLKPLGVKNPFSSQLTYADDRLQGRRDQPKYLNLIKSVAFLRQMQKKINGNSSHYIEVEPEDIKIANDLAKEILGRSLDELSRPGRDLLMLLDEMAEKQSDTKTDFTFTRRGIREYTGWSNTRVHRYLKELVEFEYILIESGRNGSRYLYCLAYKGQGKDGSKFILGLTSVENLRNS